MSRPGRPGPSSPRLAARPEGPRLLLFAKNVSPMRLPLLWPDATGRCRTFLAGARHIERTLRGQRREGTRGNSARLPGSRYSEPSARARPTPTLLGALGGFERSAKLSAETPATSSEGLSRTNYSAPERHSGACATVERVLVNDKGRQLGVSPTRDAHEGVGVSGAPGRVLSGLTALGSGEGPGGYPQFPPRMGAPPLPLLRVSVAGLWAHPSSASG